MTGRGRRRAARAAAMALGASLALSGCWSGSASTGSAVSATSAASTAPEPPTPSRPSPTGFRAPSTPVTRAPAAGVFDAVVSSGGVRQWLHCAGPGPLTLVVVPGLGSTAAAWTPVLADLQRIVRTCVYDRPGLGHSPRRPDPGRAVDAGGLAGELWSLLRAAGETGPYVVLGHSFGGLVARAFVADHRSSVRGVLLAESVTPNDPTTGPYWTEAGQRVDMRASSAATRGGPPLGSLPLLVLSASRPDEDHLGGPTYGQPQWMTALWVRQQQEDLRLSTDSVQVVARSGHVLQQDDPPAVVEAVRELVAAVRTHEQLGCTWPWRSVGATCR